MIALIEQSQIESVAHLFDEVLPIQYVWHNDVSLHLRGNISHRDHESCCVKLIAVRSADWTDTLTSTVEALRDIHNESNPDNPVLLEEVVWSEDTINLLTHHLNNRSIELSLIP